MVRLGQTVHLSCVKISAISKRTKTRFDMTQVTYELSCTDINTVSKRTEMRFNMTQVT
jgi:hypothetical protein